MRNAQSGNVLFYILIGVALLAALSYTVAQSGRGNVSTLEADKAALYATEVVAYGNVLAHAAAQLRLRGYRDTELSFENPVLSGYANAGCPEDGCKIFSPDGAGVTYSAPKTEWLDPTLSASTGYGQYYITGNSCVAEVGAGGASCHSDSADDEELILILPYVDKTLCAKINDLSGVPNPSGDPPQDGANAFSMNAHKFTGSYTETYPIGDGGGAADNLKGKPSGCFEGGGTPAAGTYHYYKVLLAR